MVAPSQPSSDDHYLQLIKVCFLRTSASLFRRGVFEGGRGFDESISASADWDLFLDVTQEFPTRGHGAFISEYRQHGSNMTRNPRTMLRSEISVLKRHKAYALAHRGGADALAAGLRRSRDYHGAGVVYEVRSSISKGAWSTALKGILVLASYHPRGLLELFDRRPL